MLEKVIEFMNELTKDFEEGEVGIKKCHMNDLSPERREEYLRIHKANLEKIKSCTLIKRIEELNMEIGRNFKDINLMKIKEIGYPHMTNDDGTITYYIIVDIPIEKIVYKNKEYYIPKAQRKVWIFGTVTVTLDVYRNMIIRYNGNLKGYLHQSPHGSSLCIGNLSLRLDLGIRNKTIEMWLRELENQFSIANLDSAYYPKNTRFYREIRAIIGKKRLKAKKKIRLPESDNDETYDE